MSSNPLFLFCGGVSSVVHEKCQSLIQTCSIRPPASLSIADRTQASIPMVIKGERRKTPLERDLVIEKCGHRLPSDQFCSFCGRNRELISENIRLLLERQEASTNTLVVADFCSSSSMWTYDQSMEILQEMLPRTVLGTMIILPCRPLQGWDAYFASYCFSLSLQGSTYTIVRNLGETFYTETVGESIAASHNSTIIELPDCAERIAADILPNYLFQEKVAETGVNGIAWPYSVCSYGERVVDVRSSLLYKLQMTKKKKPTRDHLHPLKVVTSSLHRLGAFYQDICASNAQLELFNQQDSYLIDYEDLIWDKKVGSITMDTLPGIKVRHSHDITKGFRHATPGLSWTMMNDFIPTWELSENDGASVSNSSVMTGLSSRRSLQSAATNTTSSTKNIGGIACDSQTHKGEVSEHLEELGAISFQSPFGEMEIMRTSQYTQQLLSKGGYRHLFDTNFDASTIQDSLSMIDMYLAH